MVPSSVWKIQQSILDSLFKATNFSPPPRCWGAQSASHRQNGAVRSDRVRDVGPRIDALRRQDVPARRKDVVRQIHWLADTLFVRWRRLGRKEEKMCSIFLLLQVFFLNYRRLKSLLLSKGCFLFFYWLWIKLLSIISCVLSVLFSGTEAKFLSNNNNLKKRCKDLFKSHRKIGERIYLVCSLMRKKFHWTSNRQIGWY